MCVFFDSPQISIPYHLASFQDGLFYLPLCSFQYWVTLLACYDNDKLAWISLFEAGRF